MRAFAVDDSKFEIAIKRRGIYQVPFHGGIIHRRLTSRFDLNQVATKLGPISAEMKSDTVSILL
jgi:hypothetical protein